MTAYRNELDALAARHAALAGEVASKTRERDDAARLLAEAKAKARLPVLDNIRIASPCTAPWAEMVGDDRVRHCGACDKDVFNLSAMTRDEAQALVTEKAGTLCARYFQRKDGTILLADCEIGVKQRRGRRVIAAGAAALLAAGGGVAALVRSSGGDEVRSRSHDVMGVVGVQEVAGGIGSSSGDDAYAVGGAVSIAPDRTPLHQEVKGGATFRDPLPVQSKPPHVKPHRAR